MSSNKMVVQLETEIPAVATARGGGTFYPRDNHWFLKDHSCIGYFDFDTLHAQLSSDMIKSLKMVVLYYLGEYSLSHASNLFNLFKFFCTTVYDGSKACRSISAIDILNFKSALPKEELWKLGSLRGFLKRWHALKYVGVDRDAHTVLDRLRLPGNAKGNRVRSMDPLMGPFTTMEIEALQCALNAALARGEVTLRGFTLARLFQAFGQRPCQYASLKLKDLREPENGGEAVVWVPRAKQRDVVARDLFTPRPLARETYEPLAALRDSLRVEARKIDRFTNAVDEYPFFPAGWENDMPPGLEYHLNGKELSRELRDALSSLNVHSERTNGDLHITAQRFKYTIGTRAAEEGYGPLVIADLLDHSDTQSIGVYVEATPAIAERIDKRMAFALAPIAQAFAGVLVPSESAAERGGDPTSRIRSGRGTLACVGNCGKHGFCGAMAPIACYTCVCFQPWQDGPHEEILDGLIKDREDVLANTGDLRIASINDRTIYAVAEVVQMCRQKATCQP